MGLSDRDYYREHHKRQTASPSRTTARSLRKAQSWPSWLVWAVLIVAGTTGIKWVLDARQSKPFPASGQVHWYIDHPSGPLAPFTIKAPNNSDANFVVQLDQWDARTPVAMIPVRGGEAAQVQVPLGRYRMTIAKGTRWKGPGKLFATTEYSKEAVHPLEFFRVDNQINGHTIQLETFNGNIETVPKWR